MLKKLTLRNRIFIITSLLILLAFALVFLFVRPKYSSTIINERTTIISQQQEYALRRTDETIRNWLNNTNFLAEEIQTNPAFTESLARRAINYTQGLARITITENETAEMVDFTRTIYTDFNFPNEVDEWYESRLDPRLNVAWIPDLEQDIVFIVAQRAIQIESIGASGQPENLIFVLNMYFDATRLTDELVDIPLSSDPQLYEANVISEEGTHISEISDFEFPDGMIGDASYSDEQVVSIDGRTWFVMSSNFQTIPFWHIIAVEESFVLQPVRNLIYFSLFAATGILGLMIFFSWYISIRVNKPIDQILEDVDHMSNLDFDHRVREVELPEFSVMRETLENIRVTLHRYQKINVEKIILEEWKNRYMMTYSEDLIGILDNEGRFRFANNHFVEFIEGFGQNPKDVVFDDLLSDSKLELSKTSQQVHYPDPYSIKIKSGELSHFKSEETTYFYDYQFVAFQDENESPQGALVILHDKTKDRLLDIQRTDMINIIVHELKNPITGVVGLSKLMIDNEDMDSSEQLELLKEIYLSGERMNDLVNRFLDIQKLEYGRIPVEFKDVDLFQIVNEVKSITNPLLTQKKLKIDISAKGTNFTISGSKDLIFDAIQNLVSNAIKYGDQERVIDIELEHIGDTIELSVTDHGYGISIEDQSKVFDKFYRVRSNIKSVKEKGTGLGLAYVKEIMIKHHGDVQLESNDDIGSRFTLIFPTKDALEKT